MKITFSLLSQFTDSLSVLVFYTIVSFGLGHLFSFRTKNNYLNKVIIGFYLTPFAIVLLTTFITNNLKNSFLALLTISLIGFLLHFSKKQCIYDLKLSLSNKSNQFIFSLIILMTLFYVGYLIFFPYEASYWDEFSHWLTQPLQYFYHNNFISEKFTQLAYINYTPGQPLTGIYYDKVFNNHLKLNNLMISYFFHFLIAIYFFFKSLNYIFTKSILSQVLFALIILAFCKFSLPNSALIENSQNITLIIFFSYFFNIFNNKESSNSFDFTSTVLLASIISYSYLLKSGMSLLIIIAIFGLLLSKNNILNNLKTSTFFLFLFAVSFISWKYTFNDFSHLLNHDSSSNFISISYNFMTRSQIITESLVLILKSKYFIVLSITSILLFKKSNVKLLILTYIYFFIYYLALITVYIFLFAEYEAIRLAAFDRYMSIAYFAVFTSTFYSLFANLDHYSHSLKYSNCFVFIENFLAHNKIKFNFLLYILFIFLFFFILQNKFKQTRTSEFAQSIQIFKSVNEFTYNQNIKVKNLMIVDQNSENLNGVIIQYISLKHKSGPYKADYLTSFGPEQDNVWRQIQTKDEMLDRIKSKDVTVVLKTDEWFDQIIILNFPDCYRNKTPYIIYFTKNRYKCENLGPI